MIELYLSKVTENSETEQAGKLYARVSYKQTLSVQDMAKHMSEHNTMFSEGSITGILIDFVKCVREQVLSGNTVKIDNLAIFKATVEANALETLYDAQNDKVASASIGTLAEGQKTGPAVKTIKLLAQSTGDFTRDELKKDAKLSWTDKTKALLLPRARTAEQATVLQAVETAVAPAAVARHQAIQAIPRTRERAVVVTLVAVVATTTPMTVSSLKG